MHERSGAVVVTSVDDVVDVMVGLGGEDVQMLDAIVETQRRVLDRAGAIVG
jgi:hypothetical protein